MHNVKAIAQPIAEMLKILYLLAHFKHVWVCLAMPTKNMVINLELLWNYTCMQNTKTRA